MNREGRYAEAEELARKAIEGYRRTLGPLHPDSLEVLTQLGIALAHTGHYSEADKLFHQVIDKPESSGRLGNPWSAWYGVACVATAGSHTDEALQYLKEAINRGYKDPDRLTTDYDLRGLRNNPHFQKITAQLRQNTLAKK